MRVTSYFFCCVTFFAIGCGFLILGGCTSTPWRYQGTPYESYTMRNAYLPEGDERKKIEDFVRYTKTNPDNFSLHWGIAAWTFRHGHLGSSLYALREANTIRPGDEKVNFNTAVILSLLGLNDSAKGRMLYVENKASDYFLKNRAIAAVLEIEAGKELTREFFVENY